MQGEKEGENEEKVINYSSPITPDAPVAQQWVGYLVYFLAFAAYAFVNPFLPIIYQRLSFSNSEIGWLSALHPFSGFLGASLGTGFGDRTGRHKAVLIVSLVICTIPRVSLATVSNFYAAAAAIILTNLIGASVFPLIDYLIMQMLRGDRSRYGNFRLWGSLGWGVTSPCAGYMLANLGITSLFVAHAATVLLFIVAVLFLKADVKMIAKDNVKNILKVDEHMNQKENMMNRIGAEENFLLQKEHDNPNAQENDSFQQTNDKENEAFQKLAASIDAINKESEMDAFNVSEKSGLDEKGFKMNPNQSNLQPSVSNETSKQRALLELCKPSIVVFFTVVFVLGSVMGMINTILFLHLKTLGASESLMGLCIFITASAEIPFFFYSGKMIKALEVRGVLLLSLFCFTLRLSYYSLLTTASTFVLPAETLHGITFAASWAATTIYVAEIAPKGHEALMQGMMAAVNRMGVASGSLMSGAMFDLIGPLATFRIMAAICGITMLAFWGMTHSNNALV